MATVAIIGANGQLGTDCRRAFEEADFVVHGLNHDELDIADVAATQRVIEGIRPEVIVNTAAMHNVEACEADPVRAFEVNGVGTRNLAMAAEESGARLIHISTDYVFDGAKQTPYSEEDNPRPLNVYGNTKLSGEFFVLSESSRGVVLRTSALYGQSPCRAKGGLNFVRLMLKLARERGEVKVVQDELVSPTNTLHLARQLVALSGSDETGVFHATSEGQCSWFDFAAAIFALSGTSTRLLPASSSDFPAKVRRPAYSVLDNSRLKMAGLDRMPHWHDSLITYLEEIGERVAEAPLHANR